MNIDKTLFVQLMTSSSVRPFLQIERVFPGKAMRYSKLPLAVVLRT